jgi:hypothetical protein
MWLKIGKLLVTVAVVVALLFGALSLWASHRDKVVQQAWAASRFGSLSALPARFPAAPTNSQALRLEELAARFGLDLVPRWRKVDGGRAGGAAHTAPFSNVKQAAKDYVNGQLRSADDHIAEPPRALATFLSEQSRPLSALRQALISDGAPQWETAFAKGFEAPLPNMLGILDLQFLLVADALTHARAGENTVAAECLEASWQLSAGLWRRPDLLSKLVAAASATMQAGAARRMPLPEVWAARFETLDPLASVLDAFVGEAWAIRDALTTRSLREIKDAFAGLPRWVPINRPWLMLSASSHNEAMLRLVSYLAERPLCTVDFVSPSPVFAPHFPVWDIVDRAAWPSNHLQLVGARVLRLQLDLELSARVLRLRAVRRASGRWPSELAGAVTRACPSMTWTYRVNADGTAALAFAGTALRLPDESWRLQLPLTHVLGTPAASKPSGR